jgi:hypothetical protein
MSDAVAISKFVIAFAVAYALLYVLSVQYNLALFTYHAATEEFHFLVQPTTDGPRWKWRGCGPWIFLAQFFLAAVWLNGDPDVAAQAIPYGMRRPIQRCAAFSPCPSRLPIARVFFTVKD